MGPIYNDVQLNIEPPLGVIREQGVCPLHSQKQSAHWAVDVTAQVVPC